MTHFSVGEEVLLDGERYVVSHIDAGPSGRVRLLATTPEGARMVWSTLARLGKMESYTRPDDDTDRNAWRP